MKENKFLHFIDPYKQSVFYFKTDFFGWLVFWAVCIFLYTHRTNIWILCLLYNPLFSYPGIWIHAALGHMFLAPLSAGIFTYLFQWILPPDVVLTVSKVLWASAGSLSECLLPFIGLIICLRTAGGRYVLPVLLYWLSVATFDWGMYILKPEIQTDIFQFQGVENGDWPFIMDTLGLQAYAEPIGSTLIFLAIVLFVLAVWSPFYYWRHMDQYPIPYCEFW